MPKLGKRQTLLKEYKESFVFGPLYDLFQQYYSQIKVITTPPSHLSLQNFLTPNSDKNMAKRKTPPSHLHIL